jgi:thiamine pyrophosphate-dependent acetolactate synthase large subunit-like protein
MEKSLDFYLEMVKSHSDTQLGKATTKGQREDWLDEEPEEEEEQSENESEENESDDDSEKEEKIKAIVKKIYTKNGITASDAQKIAEEIYEMFQDKE